MNLISKKLHALDVELKIYRCGANIWKMFRSYHYLNGSLGAGVRCYCAVYLDKPVAFAAIIHTRMKTYNFRVSRLVVLPDYQGIGIGRKLLNFIAELYTSQTHLPFYLVTSNPQLIKGNLDNWRIRRVGHGSHGREDTRINRELVNSNSRRRLSVSMVYDPNKKSNKTNLLC
jgi:GNAT superfamily N-acetyltransferase